MFEDEFLAWASPYVNILNVVDLIKQPIHFITPDGLVQYVNQAWVDAYKVPRQDVIHRHISSIGEITRTMNYYLTFDEHHHDLAESIADSSYNYLKVPTNTPACIQAIQQRRDVAVISQMPDGGQVIVRSTPIFDDSGKIVLVFTQVQDLSMMANWRDKLEEEVRKNNRMQEELQYLRENQTSSNLIGNSREMTALRKLISVIAKTDATVLISGESGVGKEVVAREIYNQSLRSKGAFVTINCAAIPENLLESELFGYEKGAFTGAYKTKLGLFEVADGGTIMLDEIGEFPHHLQSKLLRVLQEREIRRVGGTQNIPVNVRVIAATNKDLLEQVNADKFRCDLYYRLNVVPIHIPPLRGRREDIALLASNFLMQFNKKYKTSKFFLSQAVMLLEQHDWPGNVRELENVVERLVIVSSSNAITPQQVLMVFSGRLNIDANTEDPPVFSLKEAVDQLEKKMICEALTNYQSTYKAAKVLGMSQSTLVRKAKALEVHKGELS
jgi:transcriptional regulator with PAS, ATPase and Fis domain